MKLRPEEEPKIYRAPQSNRPLTSRAKSLVAPREMLSEAQGFWGVARGPTE
jgi:hypothetical protein